MKITVYTIKDCAFSKQEKEYLNTNKLAFIEKDLETNKSFLTEMLAISNNFAGTPVTRIEKEDGTISVLKGFTKEEFDKVLGLTNPQVNIQTPTTPTTDVQTPTAPIPEPINEMPVEVPPVVDVPTPTVPVEQPSVVNSEAPVEAIPVTPPVAPPAQDDPLKSIMDDLQMKSQAVAETAPVAPPTQPVDMPAEQPTIEPLPSNAPSIPDFPAK